MNELVAPFGISQPAISKHIKVLERAGLVVRSKDAQRRPVKLRPEPLAEACAFLEGYREQWEAAYTRLDQLLTELKATEEKHP